MVYGKNDAALKDRLAKAMEDLDDMQKAVVGCCWMMYRNIRVF